MKGIIILFLLALVVNSHAEQAPIVTNEPSDYLFLKDRKNQELYFKKGKQVFVAPEKLCDEINKLHTGNAIDLEKNKISITLKFILSCNEKKDHNVSVSLNPQGIKLADQKIEILSIYKEDEDTYSFIANKYYFKLHVWNDFNGRSGIVRLLIYDRAQNKIITSVSPLKNKK